MMSPARAGSAQSKRTRAVAAAWRRLFGLEARTIVGALGLIRLPGREPGQGPRRRLELPARCARQELTLLLYIVRLSQLLRFSCELLFPSLPPLSGNRRAT